MLNQGLETLAGDVAMLYLFSASRLHSETRRLLMMTGVTLGLDHARSFVLHGDRGERVLQLPGARAGVEFTGAVQPIR